jgi:hypothetical protein
MFARTLNLAPADGKGDFDLCLYLAVPLWTPARIAAKRFAAELAEQGGNLEAGFDRLEPLA